MVCAVALAIGLLFPNVQVRSLAGENLETRKQRGTPLVYLVGFTHESRSETEAWRRSIAKATAGSLRAIEMPVLSGMAVLMRPVIEGSMTRKTPESERGDIQTTTDHTALVDGLRLTDPDLGAVVTLVDAKGVIRLLLCGAPTADNQAALLSSWQQLKGER